MDKITKEVFELFGLNFEIIHKTDFSELDSKAVTQIPRWDIYLYDYIHNHYEILDQELIDAINDVRNRVLKLVNKKQTHLNTEQLKHSYLILKRSKPPKFFTENGGAEIKGYGTQRRELLGINGIFDELKDNKERPEENITLFEPEKYSLAEQIRAFSSCKGVLGIRGAEFANLIWMKSGSKVVHITPAEMGTTSFQRTLALIRKLDFKEVITQKNGFYPKLTKQIVTDYLFQSKYTNSHTQH
jgi:hypothetical protein